MLKFQTLEVWKKAINFADKLCEIAESLNMKYQYSFGDQLRRAALSVPSNIAEGNGRGTKKESNYFYKVARGSVYESINILVLLSRRKLWIANDEIKREIYNLSEDISKMLAGLIK